MDFSKNLIPYLLFGLPLMVMMNGICPPLTSRLRLHTILDNPWISMPSRYGTSHQPWSTSHRFNLHAGTYQNTHFTPGIIIGPSGQIWQGPCTLFRRGWDPNPLMEIPNLLIEIPWIVRERRFPRRQTNPWIRRCWCTKGPSHSFKFIFSHLHAALLLPAWAIPLCCKL